MIAELIFTGSPTLLRVVAVGALAYIVLVAMLRISGKRTLSTLGVAVVLSTIAAPLMPVRLLPQRASEPRQRGSETPG